MLEKSQNIYLIKFDLQELQMEEKSSVDVKLVLVLIMATCRGLVLGQNYPVCTVPQITVINQILGL